MEITEILKEKILEIFKIKPLRVNFLQFTFQNSLRIYIQNDDPEALRYLKYQIIYIKRIRAIF